MHEKHFGTFFFFADTHIHQKFKISGPGRVSSSPHENRIPLAPPPLALPLFSLSYSHCSSLLLRFADQQQKKRAKQFMRSLTCDLISFLLLITVNIWIMIAHPAAPLPPSICKSLLVEKIIGVYKWLENLCRESQTGASAASGNK